MTETKSRQMKPSGVPWLGDIPDGWDIVPSSRVFSEIKQKAGKNNKLPRLAFRYGEIVEKECEGISDTPQQDENATCTVVHSDVIMINGLNLNYDLLSQRVAIVSKQGVITSAYLAVDPVTIVVFPRFAMYLFKGYDARMVFHGFGSGIRKTLKFSDFKDIPFLLPPLPEQRAIADFLDEKCAAIDAIVEEAKSGIEEYAKWKQSVVFQAVTKGLDPHAKMKDSGVEWIGEIPEEWEVSRIKNELDNLDYLREPISAENRDNKLGLYDYYGASGAIDKIDHFNVEDRVLLIGEDGANLRLRNLPLVYRAAGKFWVNNHAHILKEKPGNDYGFLAYALEAGDYNPIITGSAQPKLSQSNLMAFPIAIPPLPEQRAIANYLDEKCAAIDALIEEKKQLIEDLGVYKKSLIFETVTGKRGVFP